MSARRIDLVEAAAFGGAVLFVVCLYTSPPYLIPATAVLRPAMLGATLMLGGVVLRRVLRGTPLRLGGGVGAAMVLLFSFALLSALWAFSPHDAVAFFFGTIKLLFAYVGIVGALSSPRRIRKLMEVAAFASVIPAIGTLQRYHDGVGLVEGFRGTWIGLLANPNQLAMVMAVTLPWALLSALWARGAKRLLLLGAVGLQCATIVVTHSRGGALGMAMALVAFAIFAERRVQALALVGLLAAAVAVFAPKSFWQRTETIGAYQVDASAQDRIRSWETGLAAFEDHPLLGIGAGGYLHAWDRYQPRNVREKAYASHNMWMQVVVELGAIGTLLFATMIALMLRGLWRARRSEEYGREARALLASFTALVVCGSTAGYAFNWFFYMALGVAGAVVAGARRSEARERAHVVGFALA